MESTIFKQYSRWIVACNAYKTQLFVLGVYSLRKGKEKQNMCMYNSSMKHF